jgi:hypothetical protein
MQDPGCRLQCIPSARSSDNADLEKASFGRSTEARRGHRARAAGRAAHSSGVPWTFSNSIERRRERHEGREDRSTEREAKVKQRRVRRSGGQFRKMGGDSYIDSETKDVMAENWYSAFGEMNEALQTVKRRREGQAKAIVESARSSLPVMTSCVRRDRHESNASASELHECEYSARASQTIHIE